MTNLKRIPHTVVTWVLILIILSSLMMTSKLIYLLMDCETSTQPAFTFSKLIIETLEQGVEYV